MGNQIPSIHNSENIYETSKTIQELFFKAWPVLQTTLNEEGVNLTASMKLQILQYLDNDIVNYGLGAMFGAFIGDALGSYLQFQTKISSKYADQAMQMLGGGRAFPFLLPGQFTDDSQLASHMLRGLLDYNSSKALNDQQSRLLLQIAYQYNQWYNSSPFDIGHTTRSAMRLLNNAFSLQKKINELEQQKQHFFETQIKLALKNIKEKNASSESNGSLMRITPMAFFISLIMENSQNSNEKEFKDFHNLVKNEINMTHGNQTIFQTSEAYVNLLVGLIRRKDKTLNEIYQQFQAKYNSKEKMPGIQSIKYAQEWINDSKKKPPSAISSMGWAKIAFTYTLINLRKLIEKEQNNEQFMNSQTYKELIRSVLILGGDTDTNGAIVGGMLGAVVGFKNLPKEYLQKQLRLKMGDIKKSKDWLSKRTQYEPHRTLINAIKLIQKFQINKSEKSQLKKSQKKQTLTQKMSNESKIHVIEQKINIKQGSKWSMKQSSKDQEDQL